MAAALRLFFLVLGVALLARVVHVLAAWSARRQACRFLPTSEPHSKRPPLATRNPPTAKEGGRGLRATLLTAPPENFVDEAPLEPPVVADLLLERHGQADGIGILHLEQALLVAGAVRVGVQPPRDANDAAAEEVALIDRWNKGGGVGGPIHETEEERNAGMQDYKGCVATCGGPGASFFAIYL